MDEGSNGLTLNNFIDNKLPGHGNNGLVRLVCSYTQPEKFIVLADWLNLMVGWGIVSQYDFGTNPTSRTIKLSGVAGYIFPVLAG
jgi:hypothetical protein